jgi:hypothetical protein
MKKNKKHNELTMIRKGLQESQNQFFEFDDMDANPEIFDDIDDWNDDDYINETRRVVGLKPINKNNKKETKSKKEGELNMSNKKKTKREKMVAAEINKALKRIIDESLNDAEDDEVVVKAPKPKTKMAIDDEDERALKKHAREIEEIEKQMEELDKLLQEKYDEIPDGDLKKSLKQLVKKEDVVDRVLEGYNPWATGETPTDKISELYDEIDELEEELKDTDDPFEKKTIKRKISAKTREIKTLQKKRDAIEKAYKIKELERSVEEDEDLRQEAKEELEELRRKYGEKMVREIIGA